MKKKKIISFIILIILFFLLVLSIYKIIIWDKDNKEISKQVDKIDNIVEVKENNNGELINPTTESDYIKYSKMALIDVNLDELKKINSDTIGWIQVKGTNINYPFVQTKDNDYYLTHAFDKSYNSAGWIWMDYRNNNTSDNTILYGHGRLDKTMFGSLKKILKSDWYKNDDNYVVKISTEKENTLWQVFSVYKIKNTNDYITTDFSDSNEYQEFLNMLISRSYFNFNTKINSNDKIITLSTCYDNNNKVVLHAKLIKKETK